MALKYFILLFYHYVILYFHHRPGTISPSPFMTYQKTWPYKLCRASYSLQGVYWCDRSYLRYFWRIGYP